MSTLMTATVYSCVMFNSDNLLQCKESDSLFTTETLETVKPH